MTESLISDTAIQITRKLTNQLLHLAQLSPDLEICGLVASKNGIPCSCYPVANVAELPQQRFLLDAKQQIAAMADMRERGETLFAIYHSHPKTPPQPSRLDLEQFAYPDALYLIISLNIKGVLEMRGFKIKPHQATEVPLVLL
ncbi:MAG: M67 family metallopeptidase [Methylococcaceae bacterium]|nr:M67 family metallopeptidase [Methylococcaceae bacterium]